MLCDGDQVGPAQGGVQDFSGGFNESANETNRGKGKEVGDRGKGKEVGDTLRASMTLILG